jgi:hypothetical protein
MLLFYFSYELLRPLGSYKLRVGRLFTVHCSLMTVQVCYIFCNNHNQYKT